jgi:hypothetical protein
MKRLEPAIQRTGEVGLTTDGTEMPLMDREEAVRDVQSFIECNATAYLSVTRRKSSYKFLTVTAGTGFGKTRLCHEISSIAVKSRADVLKASERHTCFYYYVNNILQFTKSVVTIFLDLSNGDCPTLPESTYAKMNCDERRLYASQFLAQRVGARGLFNCSYQTLYRTAAEEGLTGFVNLLNDLNEVFQLIAHVKEASQNDPVCIVLVLDNVNYLFNYEGLATEVIKVIGLMCDEMKSAQAASGVVLFPVISGTSVHGVRKAFRELGYGNSVISLGLLKFSSAKLIFEKFLPSKAHLLASKWMARLLLLYGNTPAILDAIIMHVQVADITESTLPRVVELLDSLVIGFVSTM